MGPMVRQGSCDRQAGERGARLDADREAVGLITDSHAGTGMMCPSQPAYTHDVL
jgi:hypothetical protein